MGLRTDDALRVAHGAPAAVKGALTEGFQSTFLTGAGLAVLGIVLAVTLIRSRTAGRTQRGNQSR